MLERQWVETRQTLGSAPDLYLVHSVTPESPALRDPALLGSLRHLADNGTTVGLSTSGPHQAASVDAALNLASSPFTAVQSTWNLFERSVGDALGRATEHGWKVVVKEALANGRLTTRSNPLIDRIATEHRTSADAVAIGAALAQPWADVVLSGAAIPAHLESNIRAEPIDIGATGLDQLAEPPMEYWRRRSARQWM